MQNLLISDVIICILLSSFTPFVYQICKEARHNSQTFLCNIQQIRNLAGHTANPRFIQKIAFVCLNYHPLIEQVDTIRAFHFGENFLVEVDIVLPKEMCLKEAHDIGEGLQKKLEKLETVERAFVHLDYEFSHRPETEHKIV
ncbi:unnamed protein product [Schistosoma margrebowiei]|uniref:Cation efflux protein cytoplasmic domain-containing protein n=1 Tax=Schistosoma margrebowiei TaxID=48269 RepID=A0A3P8I9T9_9TREM|nr:unnamed protein product [Schistosoma margrebowiei]